MALAGTDTANYTFPLFTQDGRRREISLNATARRGPSGEIIGVIGVGQDITELNQISAQNERLAADWQRLIETANAPIFGVDADGNVSEWNAKSAEISGYSKQETIGRPLVREFITPEHQERVKMVLNMAMTGVETANFEFPLAKKDGTLIHILLNATTKRDEVGAVVGVLGVGQDITNLRAALTENSRIADDLMRVIDTANAPILGIDTAGRITEWNQKAADVSCYGKLDVLGELFVQNLITEDFRADVNEVLTKALNGADTANYTFPLYTKDGRRREISLNATARRGPRGEITGVIGVGQDITELNRISAQNQRLANEWQRFIETATAPIFGVDLQGKVNEWNAKAAEISGFSKEEAIDRPFVREFITIEHRERVHEVLTQAINGVEAADFEFPLTTKDGRHINILLNASTKRDEHGAVKGVLGVGQDITNLRKALTENSRIADDLTRLIDTANAPILGIDTLGRVTEWNQKAAEVSGYSKEDSLGKGFVDSFISEEFREDVRQVLDAALSGKDTANYTWTLFTKDGRRRDINLNATARRGPLGEIIGVIGVGQDLTELKQISAQHERLAADWQRLVETANAPIFGVNADGNVNEWNSKAAEISGFSKEETMGRPLVRDFINPEHRERVQAPVQNARDPRRGASLQAREAARDRGGGAGGRQRRPRGHRGAVRQGAVRPGRPVAGDPCASRGAAREAAPDTRRADPFNPVGFSSISAPLRPFFGPPGHQEGLRSEKWSLGLRMDKIRPADVKGTGLHDLSPSKGALPPCWRELARGRKN